LRSANGTQKEHQDVALAIKAIFDEQFPAIAEALKTIKEEEEKTSPEQKKPSEPTESVKRVGVRQWLMKTLFGP
jgi:thymidylate synthase ThyX